MPALTKVIQRGRSSTSVNASKKKKKAAENEPGKSLESDTSCTILKFDDYYKIERKLSKGSFGVVYVTLHTASNQEYAVKVIERKKLTDKERSSVEREVGILKDCRDVNNIVQLVDFFVSPEHFYVVQVYAQGGDVFERLAQRTSYTENDARILAKHLLEAIQILHSRRIAHRDLKPENLLLRDVLDDSAILVADFGFASYIPEEGLKTRCGTPAFVAPEVLVPNCRYDERVDMWSVGCLLYMLLGGYPPFQDRNHKGLFKKVRGADYVFHEAYWKNVSVAAKQLISGLLTVDPKYRCTAESALTSYKWLTMDEKLLMEHDLSASLSEIKKFHAKRTLKGAMHAVLWSVKMRNKSEGDGDFSNHMDSDDWDKEGTAADLNGDEQAPQRDALVKESSDSVVVKSRQAMGFYDVYSIGELIHSSHAANIYECYHQRTDRAYAVKIIVRKEKSRKSVKGKTMAETVLHEVAILDSLEHRNIMGIKDFFEDDEHFYLVMERMRGGDVYDRITKQKRYSEINARKLAQTLLSAIAFLHEKGYAHRDLKPQNLLLRSPDDCTDIKISDFGFACKVKSKQSLTTRCGTPTYVAPEILKNIPYDQSADMWSIGVIMYVVLSGRPPFADSNQSELFRKIRTCEYNFMGEEWEIVSFEAKDFLRKLLVGNPLQRMTAAEALEHIWLKEDNERGIIKSKDNAETLNLRTSKIKISAETVQTRSPTTKASPRRKSQTEKDLGPEHLRRFEV